jgi:SAM-dependent methyltransferase
MTTHWARHLRHWELLGPPLRPHRDVVDRVLSLIGSGTTPCLLLGSTVEYAALRSRVISVDATFPMVAGLWRHGDPSRLGIQADWTCMPIRPQTFSHVLGDGSLNAIPWATLPLLFDEVRRVLQPRGILIARVFCRPETAETPEDIRRDVVRGRAGSFHALKWRVAMSMLGDEEQSDIAVKNIRRAVMAAYPDREELCRITGWVRAEVGTLDVYETSDAIYNFPTEAMIVALLRRWFAEVELVRCGTYPLAERCPVIVAREALPTE